MASPNVNLAILKLKSRILGIKANHGKYTLTTNVLDENISIAYSTLPLKIPCKTVDVYYSGECLYTYKQLLGLYGKVTTYKILNMETSCSDIEVYVRGWSHNKIISDTNISFLHDNTEGKLNYLKQFHDEFDTLLSKFQELNVHDDTEMVDHFKLSLYRTTTEVPYRRIYNHFFKKGAIVSDSLIEAHINRDIDILDRLQTNLLLLYSGWDKVGKGDEYEVWRIRQSELIDIIQLFADVIEQDIMLYEKMGKLNELVICFKVYPVRKD